MNLKRFDWISRDGKLVILARASRTFAVSVISVIFALYLDELEFSLIQIGLVISLGIASTAVYHLLVSLLSEKIGRRKCLVFLAILRLFGMVVLILSNRFAVIAVFSFLGTIAGFGTTEPVQSLELAILPDTASGNRRTDVFAVYGIGAIAVAAVGSLVAGLSAVMEESFGFTRLMSFRILLGSVSVFFILTALWYALLSPAVETKMEDRRWLNPFRLPSRKIIFTLTGLFSVDSFAGSMVLPSLAAYWFTTRFGMDIRTLAYVVAISRVLMAISQWISAKIAKKLGPIRTMVFTHIPSQLFLIAAAFAPSVTWAIVFWLCRAALMTMDMPPRQAFTMSVVKPEERVAMAGIPWMGRSVAGTIGPTVSTAIWNALSASASFFTSALVMISYDVSLFLLFRKTKLSMGEDSKE